MIVPGARREGGKAAGVMILRGFLLRGDVVKTTFTLQAVIEAQAEHADDTVKHSAMTVHPLDVVRGAIGAPVRGDRNHTS